MEKTPSEGASTPQANNEVLDLAEVRSSFPALREDEVFLDNAGGSQTLGTVIDS